MSGDVQPRKRKDKKRKKDELGVEEPRGTAAALGEGDVFMHSQHEHGTGGHWCAKIIFFSLLAVLITLIGLIILENRGLSELEANSVESRYSGVLEGWLEDAPDDDHHDEHTLELNHPDDDEDDHDDEHGRDDDDHDHDNDDDEDDDHEDEHDDDLEDENDDDDEHEHDVDHEEDANYDDHNEDEEQNQSENDDDDEEQQDIEDSQEDNDEDEDVHGYRKYFEDEHADDDNDDDENDHNDDDDDDDRQPKDESEEVNERQAVGSNEDDDNDSIQNNDIDHDDDERDEQADEENLVDNEEEEEHDEEDEEDPEVEIEKIEKEIDLEPISTELPALPEEDDDDDKSEERSTEIEDKEDEEDGIAPEDLDDDFLEDDSDEPRIEHITAPPVGKPFVEVEEEDSSEQPPDTLAEEEEYEKQQEEKRREEEKSGHMWLKLTVGGALLVATHAVIRRATAPREAPAEEERSNREETPLTDRRMTLIPEEPVLAPRISTQAYTPPKPKEEVVQRAPIVSKAPPPQEEEDEEDEDEKEPEDDDIEVVPSAQDTEDKELYSDEEEVEEEEIKIKKEAPKFSAPKPEEKVVAKPEPEPEDDPDDVEIIDDEQIEEELEEEEDEEDISDVDDAELLSRLEAKYGRLPEPERPGQKHQKDGGNSIEDEWPGEPSDAFWRQELDSAERDLRQGAWAAAAARAAAPGLRGSARARWLAARGHDLAAEARRDNALLGKAIAAYLELLKMNERLSDKRLKEVAARTLDRIMFRGNYLSAEPVYRLLIRRFPEEVEYRNNLTISYLMANRADLAEEVLKETLQKWPNDRVALAHYGFVLKTLRNRLEEAVEAFQKALEGDTGPANEPRFYYHLGDALLLLGRPAEAHEVHKRGAKLGHFLSPAQRSLYNVPRLKSRPWWNVDETPYAKLARALESSWKEILKEGEAAKALYEKEKEGLKERGEWSQLDLFARGQEIPNRCQRAPVTCAVVRSEAAAVGCRRGQVKFSAMEPGTHVRPHVGPTNCRLRMHLALSNTKDTFIRVDQTIRQWQAGKVLMFDDSFEHEVWHNGTGSRLVLIVDVWHPDLTPRERRELPAI